MEIQYQFYHTLPLEPQLTALLNLLTDVFDNESPSDLRAKLINRQRQTGIYTGLALSDGVVVGCKLGYERRPGHFYSWLGCVAPAFRGNGIAAELMRRQHEWCRRHNYQTVRTQTYNQWRSMLILNLRAGFDIIGTMQGKHGLTIVLEKTF
ncbi:GNAT family N-acetyltransferase [Spirosoma spitsbergense]|uniref:GNAT family N-acetyltransferase n=1 Tax=Spirosoma spitsbergense TaxID=431554 RepID=UPI00036B8175|nr:GNAT family N-acetyltransferase [Spirosoma spitsbergense]